jgi:hypothetical protein
MMADKLATLTDLINSDDIVAVLAENKRLLAENAALLREIELLEIALSEPKQRRRRRDDDD